MKTIYYKTITGKTIKSEFRTGPKSKGYTKISLNLPPEDLELMRIINEQCGCLNPVSSQIRFAIKMYLSEGLLYKPVYMGLLKT